MFGKTVADVSLNAIANLGYAACRFLEPVYPGGTPSATSEVIGLKENSNRESGVVTVRSHGFNQHGRGDYAPGERIDHVDGVTVEEAERQIATRLYQNAAKAHFNLHSESQGRFGRRLIYGGHVISLARALSFNGLANAFHIAAVNGGRHIAPLFAGDTAFAWSEVVDSAALPGRADVGALPPR